MRHEDGTRRAADNDQINMQGTFYQGRAQDNLVSSLKSSKGFRDINLTRNTVTTAKSAETAS